MHSSLLYHLSVLAGLPFRGRHVKCKERETTARKKADDDKKTIREVEYLPTLKE